MPHMSFVFLSFILGIGFNTMFAIAILQDKEYPNWYAYIMIGFALIIIGYILALVLGPPYGTVEARIIESLGQKIVVYALMALLIVSASGFLTVLKRKQC